MNKETPDKFLHAHSTSAAYTGKKHKTSKPAKIIYNHTKKKYSHAACT